MDKIKIGEVVLYKHWPVRVVQVNGKKATVCYEESGRKTEVEVSQLSKVSSSQP